VPACLRKPLRARVAQERQAITLAHDLVGFAGVDVHPDGAREVVVDYASSDQLVVRVLDAVRQALGGDRSAYALVQLDGRDYQLCGE
jgi:hypothetical protein